MKYPVLAGCLLAAMATAVPAAQVSQSMVVQANVIAGACTLDPVSTVSFGDVLPSTGPLQAFNVSFTCTSGLSYKLGMGAGLNPTSPTNPIRRMRLAATSNYIGYGIYKDSSAGVEWGDSDLSSPTYTLATSISGTATGALETINGSVLASVPAAAPAGLYTDTVNVVLEF